MPDFSNDTRRPAKPFLTRLISGLTLSTALASTAARAQDVNFTTPDGRAAAIHIVPRGGNPRIDANVEIWVENNTPRNPSGLTNVCLINPQDGKSRRGSVTTSDTGPVIPNSVMTPVQMDMERLGKAQNGELTDKAIADAKQALRVTNNCRQSPKQP